MRRKIWLCLLLFLSFTSCKVGRFVWYNFAGITDYKIFPYRKINTGTTHFTFHINTSPTDFIPDSISVNDNKVAFEDYLKANKTVAFLVIRNDTVLYEKYFSKYDDSSIVASFSMAKSVTSILTGCAIDEGIIGSIEDPITQYLPELKDNGFDKVRIRHLLNMTSGIKFNESYVNPFGQAASIYYGRNLNKFIRKLTIENEPGTVFHYSSGDSQLLGMVLASALKDKSVTAYLEEKLWRPLGMEFDATWSLDRQNGMEKTFCCINARARDFAKIGRLYLNKGNWNGEQIVSQNWVENSIAVDTTAGSPWFYQNQWWLPSREGDFMAEGILGQFIYVNPQANIIIVRLGKKYGKTGKWPQLFRMIAKLVE